MTDAMPTSVSCVTLTGQIPGETPAISPVTQEGDPDRSDSGGNAGNLTGQSELLPALEAILLVVDEPVSEMMLAQVLERSIGEITAALRQLATEYAEAERGFDLRSIAGGWRIYSRETLCTVCGALRP